MYQEKGERRQGRNTKPKKWIFIRVVFIHQAYTGLYGARCVRVCTDGARCVRVCMGPGVYGSVLMRPGVYGSVWGQVCMGLY